MIISIIKLHAGSDCFLRFELQDGKGNYCIYKGEEITDNRDFFSVEIDSKSSEGLIRWLNTIQEKLEEK